MELDTLTVPIFPLPNVVFLPNTLLPLHVFEPRYKEMFADVLAGDRRIGVVQLKPGWEKDYYGNPPVYRHLGIGTVVYSQKLDDGRYDVVLEGTARARIKSETQRGDYRVAEVEILREVIAPEAREEVETLTTHLLPVFCKVVANLPETAQGLEPAVWKEPTAAVIADVLAKVFMESAYDKQSILSELDVLRRLRLVSVHLGSLLNREE